MPTEIQITIRFAFSPTRTFASIAARRQHLPELRVAHTTRHARPNERNQIKIEWLARCARRFDLRPRCWDFIIVLRTSMRVLRMLCVCVVRIERKLKEMESCGRAAAGLCDGMVMGMNKWLSRTDVMHAKWKKRNIISCDGCTAVYTLISNDARALGDIISWNTLKRRETKRSCEEEVCTISECVNVHTTRMRARVTRQMWNMTPFVEWLMSLLGARIAAHAAYASLTRMRAVRGHIS